MLNLFSVNTPDDLREYLERHLETCHSVKLGVIKDQNGEIAPYDNYWRAKEATYLEILNAVRNMRPSQ